MRKNEQLLQAWPSAQVRAGQALRWVPSPLVWTDTQAEFTGLTWDGGQQGRLPGGGGAWLRWVTFLTA